MTALTPTAQAELDWLDGTIRVLNMGGPALPALLTQLGYANAAAGIADLLAKRYALVTPGTLPFVDPDLPTRTASTTTLIGTANTQAAAIDATLLTLASQLTGLQSTCQQIAGLRVVSADAAMRPLTVDLVGRALLASGCQPFTGTPAASGPSTMAAIVAANVKL